MGIWIRSQDRKYLVNVNFAWINSNNTIYGDCNNLEGTTGTPLGKYVSEAEALAVLDMIENRLGSVRFQMPKAGFSSIGGADNETI